MAWTQDWPNVARLRPFAEYDAGGVIESFFDDLRFALEERYNILRTIPLFTQFPALSGPPDQLSAGNTASTPGIYAWCREYEAAFNFLIPQIQPASDAFVNHLDAGGTAGTPGLWEGTITDVADIGPTWGASEIEAELSSPRIFLRTGFSTGDDIRLQPIVEWMLQQYELMNLIRWHKQLAHGISLPPPPPFPTDDPFIEKRVTNVGTFAAAVTAFDAAAWTFNTGNSFIRQGSLATTTATGFLLERERGKESTTIEPVAGPQAFKHKTQVYYKFDDDFAGGGAIVYENIDFPNSDVSGSFAIVGQDPVAVLGAGIDFTVGDVNNFLGSQPGGSTGDKTGYKNITIFGLLPLFIVKWDITDFSGFTYIDAPLTSP